MAWPIVRGIGAAFPDSEVYCQDCTEWIPVTRKATPAEMAGVVTSQLPYYLTHDEPDF